MYKVNYSVNCYGREIKKEVELKNVDFRKLKLREQKEFNLVILDSQKIN